MQEARERFSHDAQARRAVCPKSDKDDQGHIDSVYPDALGSHLAYQKGDAVQIMLADLSVQLGVPLLRVELSRTDGRVELRITVPTGGAGDEPSGRPMYDPYRDAGTNLLESSRTPACLSIRTFGLQVLNFPPSVPARSRRVKFPASTFGSRITWMIRSRSFLSRISS